MDDVALLLAAFERHKVAAPSIVYRSETDKTAGLVTRSLDFKLDLSYSAFKAVMADVLAKAPHGYLKSLTVQQGAAGADRINARVELAFMYRAPAAVADTAQRR